jgi:CBS domain containing-hemolysin-like protein
MYPIIWLMNSCANALLRLTAIGRKKRTEAFYSTEELKLILSGSYLHGELTKEEQKILEHTLDLTELKVTDVMRPVDEMIALDVNAPILASLETVMRHRYSRYPIFEGRFENIIGIVHVKDIYSALFEKRQISDIKTLMRPVLKVSRRLPAFDLLRKLRGGMPHFALVYTAREDNLIGFVTLDNLLHVLVGRIQDEFHRTRDDWIKNDDGSYTMPGNASIYSLERALDIDVETEELSEDIDTLYGVILSRLETIPKVGNRVELQQCSLVVESMRGARVLQVRVYPHHRAST